MYGILKENRIQLSSICFNTIRGTELTFTADELPPWNGQQLVDVEAIRQFGDYFASVDIFVDQDRVGRHTSVVVIQAKHVAPHHAANLLDKSDFGWLNQSASEMLLKDAIGACQRREERYAK